MEHIAAIEKYLDQTQARGEALKILLSISADSDSQKLIAENKNIVKKLLDLATEDATANTALQILVNIAQDEQISLIMVQNGAFEVLFNYLKTHLKPDEKDEKSEVGFEKGENVYIVKQATQSNIPLVLMLMTNLTIYKFGRVKFMNASETPELRTFMLENIIAMTEFFKDQDIFNFGANIITNCTIDATKDDAPADADASKHKSVPLSVFESVFPMLTSIKKSPLKRLKITEAVKNLMFNYHNHLPEIKQYDVIGHIGKALIETNQADLSDVLDEGVEMKPQWMQAYENRKEVEVDIGEFKGKQNDIMAVNTIKYT